MTEKPEIHIDVFFTCMGETHPVGHGDVPYPESIPEQGAVIATLLHKLAWEYEEKAQREQPDEAGADVREFKPRVAFNRAGDRFYEIAPGEFVAGMSYEDAVETHKTFGGTSSLQMLSQAFPTGLRVEYIDEGLDI